MKEAYTGLVDEAIELHETVQELNKRLDKIKAKFKADGKKLGVSVFEGADGVVTISPRSQTECAPEELLETLVDMGRGAEFPSMVKVMIAPARKALGEMVFDEISDTTVNTHAVVKIQRR